MDQLSKLRQLPARLLDGLNVGRGSGQPDNGLWIEVHRRASWHVVERHRKRVHRLRQCQKVLKLSLLRRLVVVGVGRKHRAQTVYLLEFTGQVQQRASRVVGTSGPHRHSPASRLNNNADCPQPLFFVQRGRLAGRSAGHEKVDSRGNLPIHQRLERLFVNCPVRPEWRNNRCSATDGIHK